MNNIPLRDIPMHRYAFKSGALLASVVRYQMATDKFIKATRELLDALKKQKERRNNAF